MININTLGAIFIAMTLFGLGFAFLCGRKQNKFLWSRYVAIIIWPILTVLVFAIFFDIKILILFIISCVIGFISEYLIGLTYHKALNETLWRYDRLGVHKYTSLLSIPLWGIAGCLFWFVSKMIGL